MSDKKTEQSENISAQKKDPDYWRSFRELYNDPDFVKASHNEFKEGVKDDFNPEKLSNLSRRKFLALLGASAALAGAGCEDYRDKGEIISYNQKPENLTIGKPAYYASTCNSCPSACGILVKTREGRPIKIDGNPDHPVNKGKICAKGQASILNLYDPERIKEPLKNDNGNFRSISWDQADNEIRKALNWAGEKQIAIVTHSVFSPTQKKLLDLFKEKYSSARIYSYELFDENLRNSAWQKCYGTDQFPVIKWNKAKVIVSLEGDFLGTDGNKIENARLFAEGRDVNNTKSFNRLYVVEGNLSLTGINADYRLRVNPSLMYEFSLTILGELKKNGLPGINDRFSVYTADRFNSKYGLNKKYFSLLIDDLIANRGSSIIYCGKTLPEEVHTVVNYLNDILGNTDLYSETEKPKQHHRLADDKQLSELVSDINQGKVSVLLNIGANPVYHFPSKYDFGKVISKVSTVVSLTERENETSVLSDYVLPVNHMLESWGDAETREGIFSLQQPVISPIHNTRQAEAILLNWLSDESYSDKAYHNFLMKNWEDKIFPTLSVAADFSKFWVAALHDGVVTGKSVINKPNPFNQDLLFNLPEPVQNDGYTLVLKESAFIGDGRFASNGFLQELPHPVSKITWDNYAAISKTTAEELGVDNNDVIEINSGEMKLQIPVLVQPGSSDKTLTIELGYGRTTAGIVGTGVGFNANKFLKKKNQFILNDITISRAGFSYKLVSTQEHYAFDKGLTKDIEKKRGIIREGTLDEYLKNPDFLYEHGRHELESVYNSHPYTGVKWGMSIDLNKCLGCGECIIACNVENNIPVVGKDQVDAGREMMWLRIDRYYSGSVEEPKVSTQPMLCQHCDQAPCENVCPVVATNHSPDGLNQMIYNRCVGTRYCSNNCPYKVRRFNFFNFRDHYRNGLQEAEEISLMYNPEVTVRSRGVMEKCTFCIQRISEARAEAIRENRDVRGSDVQTACQEACPTDAIHFGDINNEKEEFYNYRNHKLGYYVLEELNIHPNVTYIAKLRNTHPEKIS
ncbi:MAG: TAT-variant-translocated molybdopterin oxidoreductase [Ignavibacteriaceae bacterium]